MEDRTGIDEVESTRNLSRKLVVGLIGGIGSGKSAVAGALARRGGRVITGDHLGHEALKDSHIRDALVTRWGENILDEKREIDRRKVAQIVFGALPEAREELKALETLVFPYIKRRIREEIDLARHEEQVEWIIVDAAVLLEAGWAEHCDRVVYVHSPRDQRLKRLEQGRGWKEKEVADREQMQLSLTEKVTRADDVVDNSGSLEDMERHVDVLVARWQELALARSVS